MQVMSAILEQNIIKILSGIENPITGKLVTSDISKIIIGKDSVTFAIYTDKQHEKEALALRERCITELKQNIDVININISLSSRTQEMNPDKRQPILGVKKIIIVASGKGGVGKSTIAVNLAIALASQGQKVGIADVDIYGPSLPTLLGMNAKPTLQGDKMIPLEKYGIKAMSIGFLVKEEDPLVWRGPMTTKMLYQLLRTTSWNHDGKELDYLILDTPPGTGDVHLSLAENYKIDGAIIVTLPQELSVKDARKSIAMYQKLNVPVLGLVENMSFYAASGKSIFGKGGADKLAKEFGIKVLASIPIYEDLAICSDMGKPLVYADPKHEVSKIFNSIATSVVQ